MTKCLRCAADLKSAPDWMRVVFGANGGYVFCYGCHLMPKLPAQPPRVDWQPFKVWFEQVLANEFGQLVKPHVQDLAKNGCGTDYLFSHWLKGVTPLLMAKQLIRMTSVFSTAAAWTEQTGTQAFWRKH